MYIFKTIFKDLSLLCRGRPPSAPENWLETSRSVFFFFFIIKFTAKLQENITSIILEKLLKAEGRFAATELYLTECHIRENIYQTEYSDCVSSR